VKVIKVDIRLIATTHQNLLELIKNGRFQADPWFRIHVFPIMIPPMRERKIDGAFHILKYKSL
jgi:transcriptional regulator with GAF, ATPase, and Fis domain